MRSGKSTVAAIAKRINLKESTLRSWKWRAENNGALYNTSRPHQVSPAIKKSLKTIISSSLHQIADREALNVTKLEALNFVKKRQNATESHLRV